MTPPAAPRPCLPCPWRLANQGRRHPDGWYTARNLARLWAGLRRGEDMSCHPTDWRNEISDAAAAAGYRPAPDTAQIRECVGAHILKQREFMLAQGAPTPGDYMRGRPKGLTLRGLMLLVQRAMFGGTALGGAPLPKPDLNDPDVGYAPLPWPAGPAAAGGGGNT